MSVGTIYSYPQNPRVFKAQVVAAYNGLEVTVDDKFVMGTTNKTEEWIAKFGASQVPAFEGVDGTIIIESGAIAYYLAHLKENSTLIGRSVSEEALIQQWIQFRHLIKKTFLVGERVTLADISAATGLFAGFKLLFDATFRKEFPAVTRWFNTIVNQTHFKAVAGEFVHCETTLKFTPPKKEKKEEKPKAEKPKAAEKPKKVEEEAEETFQDAPKPKSKLDLLPAAKMSLDEWKRQYSNSDTPVACKWLWENIDLTTDYSFWKVDYKYNDELTKLYMSNNLAGGLMNRLERARKYAFGCLVVAGEDNANIITGYFIVRGVADEMVEEVTDAADYESYDWVKVNVDEETKLKINQVFAWEGTVEGKPIMDGKVFK
ncbi:hypothetical protein BGZ83_005607 [Gryganskiella cystojenkinii]|nr:hypothetical protein BGZ83_005607 [Gryganskiella cystojenkinii]